ncbi:MAG: hypothetical protein A4E60_02125 [Syntrophorhabdus sp. PtaB.Bin047]|jgi:hypothetical protein|nr:MAG: hypothetical protein A4E60_02125 [Syntrophorhabdus sp. PtaB.Bin047]
MLHEGSGNEQRAAWPTLRQALDRYFFLKDAEHIMTAVIEPVMKEISMKLRSRGHESSIVRESQSISDSGYLRLRHISLIIAARKTKPAGLAKHPVIAFVANSEKKMVWVLEKTIVPDGSKERNAGEYQVAEITRQIVEKHIRRFLPEALGKTVS